MLKITLFDIILTPIYFIIIYFIANSIRARFIDKNPEYKYFTFGLFFKFIGGLAFTLFYSYYYGMGDSTDYYMDSVKLSNLATINPVKYLQIVLGFYDYKEFHLFGVPTGGYPCFYFDDFAFSVVRFSSIFILLGLKSYYLSTILVATFNFIGIWRLYRLLCSFYPKLYNQLAIAFLFIPSVAFWGSGIIKDSYTLSACYLIISSVIYIIVKKEKVILNFLIILIATYILTSIKPYIFFSICCAFIIFLLLYYTNKFRSILVKLIIFPAILIATLYFGIFFINTMSGVIGGEYSSYDNVIGRINQSQIGAIESKEKAQYEVRAGVFDKNFFSNISKFPKVIFFSFYRPFIWESKNIQQLISAIENLILLLLTIYTFLIIKPFNIYRAFTSDYLFSFFFVFILILAIIIGFYSTNFGGLVRFKIPIIPLYISCMFILLSKKSSYNVVTTS
ncbi:MAG: hypothetical protein HY738_09955 [Bacteroidia bacterium]|nr:hypothetical protein [Bacteroidia bacterium]